MANQKSHGLNRKNIGGFATELKNLLIKHGIHSDNSAVELTTGKVSFSANKLSDCPEQCIRYEEVCDENGENCKIVYWCDC